MIYSAASLRRCKSREVILSPIRKDNHLLSFYSFPKTKTRSILKTLPGKVGNVFKFVKLFALYQESINLKEFTDVVHYRPANGHWIVWKHQGKTHTKKSTGQSVLCLKRIIKFKAREFTERDLAYWKSYHISEKTLNFFCVKSVHKILNENSEVVWTVPQEPLHLRMWSLTR
jgi:hypothetical protein